MSRAIQYLSRFNRKERSTLLSHVLDGDVFRLCPLFRSEIEKELELWIPDDAFVAMDYHLDWLQMAIYMGCRGNSIESEVLYSDDIGLFEANQRDIDLLIAFEPPGSNTLHIVLIEAKVDTGWKGDQLSRKADRLSAIFDKSPSGMKRSSSLDIRPYFVLMSPCDPRERIDVTGWPCWMKKGTAPRYWLKLPLRDGLLKVTRCSEDAKADKEGGWLFTSEYQSGRWEKRARASQRPAG